jgi:hypothetical protein
MKLCSSAREIRTILELSATVSVKLINRIFFVMKKPHISWTVVSVFRCYVHEVRASYCIFYFQYCP